MGLGEAAVTREEIVKLEHYLKKVFRLPALQVRQRPRKEDSAEVYVDEEFIGILFRDDDEGERLPVPDGDPRFRLRRLARRGAPAQKAAGPGEAGSSKGPVGSGVGGGWSPGPQRFPQVRDQVVSPRQWLLEADIAVCGAVSGGKSEIHTSGFFSTAA